MKICEKYAFFLKNQSYTHWKSWFKKYLKKNCTISKTKTKENQDNIDVHKKILTYSCEHGLFKEECILSLEQRDLVLKTNQNLRLIISTF